VCEIGAHEKICNTTKTLSLRFSRKLEKKKKKKRRKNNMRIVHPLLECGVDHGGLGRAEGGLSHSGWGSVFFDILGREAERVYLSVQQCAN
jgi:hypothetical protein